jgi:hypothetical protein
MAALVERARRGILANILPRGAPAFLNGSSAVLFRRFHAKSQRDRAPRTAWGPDAKKERQAVGRETNATRLYADHLLLDWHHKGERSSSNR